MDQNFRFGQGQIESGQMWVESGREDGQGELEGEEWDEAMRSLLETLEGNVEADDGERKADLGVVAAVVPGMETGQDEAVTMETGMEWWDTGVAA